MRKYGFGAACLVLAVLAVVLDRHRWSWSLLAWGSVIGLAGVVGSFLIGRRAGVAPDRWDAYPSFILLSVGVAVLAAGLRNAWPNLVFAGYVAIANFAIPLLLFPRSQRAAHACSSDPSCGAIACATCPLAARDPGEPSGHLRRL